MILIHSSIVHDMIHEPFRADVLLARGKIVRIASTITDMDSYCSRILDAQGLDLYPGFIDAHSHIGISCEKSGLANDDCNESTEPVTPYLRAIDAINPMDSAFHNAVAAGVTSAMVGPGSANPIGGQFAFIKLHGRCVDDMVVKAPAAMKIAFGENPKTCYGGASQMPATRMGIAGLIRKNLFCAREYYRAKQQSQINTSAFEEDFELESYLPLFADGIPLKAHVHQADDILTAIRIAKEFHLALTLDHCTEGHLIPQEIAKSGFPAIVGPSLSARSKPEVCQLDFKTAGVLANAGVTVAITTDHPVSRIQYLPLCAALACREGLDKKEALKAITLNAAKICQVSHRLGSIETGKDADLVLFRGDPLDVSATVRYTLIDGAVVYENPAVTSPV